MRLEKPEGGDFKPAPAGAHRAVCIRFIDLGTQMIEWQGETKYARKVLIMWELTDEIADFNGEQKPFIVSRKYTWSMHEKANLRKDLESWRAKRFSDADFGPDGFDTKNLIGVPAMVTITHSEGDTVYANVTGISPLPKAMEKPGIINPTVYLSLEKDEFDREVFLTLSDKMQEIVRKSPEYGSAVSGALDGTGSVDGIAGTDLDDDIPF